jgi:LysR family transcriptional regulator, positive regulator for ilvC
VPELEDIRLTIAARNRPSFGVVARDLHVSQSTVSRAVQRIEQAVGRPLFVREARSVRAAPDAADVFDSLQQLVDDWDQVIIRARTNEASQLSVFCTVTASQLIAPPLFARFRRARPDVQVDLRTGSAGAALPAVLDGSVDVAIAPLPARLPAGLVSHPLLTTPMVAVATPDVKTFAGHTLLLSRQGLLREVSERWVRRHLGTDVEIREAETNEEVLALAAMGSGVAVVPKLVVDASALGQRVRTLVPPASLPVVTVGLVARRTSLGRDPLPDLWAAV